jgi:hypothetical protein
MKPSLRLLLAGGTALAACAGADLACAQPMPPQPPGPVPALPSAPVGGAPLYDSQQFPMIKGTVARYTLTPRGDVDGLMLTNGTEVHFPPHLSTQLVYAVKPGDAVTVRGVKALGVPLVAAVSITNDGSGQSVIDDGPGFGRGPKGPREAGQPMSVQGRVQRALHGPRGEVNGAMLDDSTILRLRRTVRGAAPSRANHRRPRPRARDAHGPRRRGAGDRLLAGAAELGAAPGAAARETRATSLSLANPCGR